MQEEWTLEPVAGVDPASGRMVIKNAYGKYLSVDVVAGGKVELRADETKEGATERWKIMMQGEFVVKAKKQYNERNGIKTNPAASYTIVTNLAGAEVDAMCVGCPVRFPLKAPPSEIADPFTPLLSSNTAPNTITTLRVPTPSELPKTSGPSKKPAKRVNSPKRCWTGG